MAENPPSGDDSRFPQARNDDSVAARAAIEQAEGILMYVFGIGGDHAFELLQSRSQTTQVRLRLLAQQLVDDVVALTSDERSDMQSTCSNLLLTVHERINPAGPDQ